METIPVIIISLIITFPLYVLVKFLHTIWWRPIRIQNMMRKQGIKGPSYKLLHGNTKEIAELKKEATSKPMDIASNHIFPRILPQVSTWTTLYGKTYLSWQGTQPQLIVMDSQIVKEVLNDKNGMFPKSDPAVLETSLLGEGIVTTAQVENWAKLRKLANHVFLRGDSLKNMIPGMIASTEMMLERWKAYEGKELEVFGELRFVTSEVISRTAFGSNYLEGKSIFENSAKLVVLLATGLSEIRIPGIGHVIKTSDEVESEKLAKGVKDVVMKMVKNREKLITKEALESYGNDFLGTLIKSNQDNDTSKRITIDELVEECQAIYVAGQETTNTLLGWTMFLLATHTDWQKKARDEVFKVCGQQNPSSDTIPRLKIVNMVINETLRLYSPFPSLQRRVKKETVLGKIVFPRDIDVIIPVLAIHHDPNIWGKDVHRFNPARFSEGVATATNNNIAAFLPFGLGPRNCVGMTYNSFEVKIVLSMILQRYSFTLSSNYVHSPCHILTIRPQHGVQIMLHPVNL